MDYLIVEEFNRFWELFAVNERLYPHRRACTLNLWMKMPQEKRSAIIEELERYGPPPNRNPYFFVQDYGRSCTQTLSFSEYYKLYGTTAERDGWKMTNHTENQVIWVRIASEITLRHVRLESDNMFVNHYKSIGYKNRKMPWCEARQQANQG